jgi:hypothetical protein
LLRDLTALSAGSASRIGDLADLDDRCVVVRCGELTSDGSSRRSLVGKHKRERELTPLSPDSWDEMATLGRKRADRLRCRERQSRRSEAIWGPGPGRDLVR